MGWRSIIVLAIMLLSGCSSQTMNPSVGENFCLSGYQEGATSFLLQNAGDVAEQAITGRRYILRDVGDDRFRVARASRRCEPNEQSISLEQAQSIIDVGAREAIARQNTPEENPICWVEIDSPKEISVADLYQTLGRAGLRYPGISSIGAHYSVGSQDDCAVVNAVARPVIERMSR